MGVISVIGEVHKNKHNFRSWEEQENNKDAQRKALYANTPPTPEELNRSKKLASTIIDTITIMDQHSEDVAENVETATGPLVGVAPLLSFYGSLLISYFASRPFFKGHDAIVDKLSYEDMEIISKANNGKSIWSGAVVPLMGKSRVKIPAELSPKVTGLRDEYANFMKKHKKLLWLLPLFVVGSTVGSYLAIVIRTTKMQVGSSRIARFQARRDLSDPKNFVTYSDEQIAQAQENLKNKPVEEKGFFDKFKKDKEDKKGGFFKTFKQLREDKTEYKKWKEENKNKDSRVKRELSTQELKVAKDDQEVIQRLTRKINNKAEEYSENMETAADVIIGSSILGGWVLGKIVPWVLEKSQAANLIAKGIIRGWGGKDALEQYIKLADIKDIKSMGYKNTRKAFMKAVEDFRDEKMKNIRVSDKRAMFKEIKQGIKGGIAMLASYPMGRVIIVRIITYPVVGIIGLVVALKLQKQAARAGRYTAKQEFLNNPQEFISYSNEEMNSVKDVKAKKKPLSQKVKEYLLFVPTAFKQNKAYSKFKKTEYKQQRALRGELIKLEVTPEQLTDGKNLQKKLFNTFEKIDDKSQDYSENMEAVNEIAQQTVLTSGVAAGFAAVIGVLVATATGKITVSSVLQKGVRFLAKHAGVMKTKWFNKYLNDVSRNIQKVIANQGGVSGEPIKKIFNAIGLDEIDLKKSTVANVLELIDKNKAKVHNVIDGLDYYQVDSLKESLKPFAKLAHISPAEIDEMFKKTFYDSGELKEGLKALINTLPVLLRDKSKIKLDPVGPFSKLKYKGKVMEGGVSEFIKELKKDLASVSDKEVKANFKELEEMVQEWLSSVRFGDVDKKSILEFVTNVEKISGNIPKDTLVDMVRDIAQKGLENPDKFITALQNPKQFVSVYYTPLVLKAGATVAVAGLGLSYLLLSYFAKMQKDAGRLGVMKAMQELSDPAFYANEYLVQDITKSPEELSKKEQLLSQREKELLKKEQELLEKERSLSETS